MILAGFLLSSVFGGFFDWNKAQAEKTLESEIAELVAQVKMLKIQLASLKNGGFVFARNLALGDEGSDVRELQILLNSDIFTRVSLLGPGSPGQETTFFGPATVSAVKRFQNKYAGEILRPNNLILPTGFVGISTRNKLNSLALERTNVLPPQQIEPILPTEDPISSFFMEDPNEFSVAMISSYSGLPGSSVTIYGSGFEADNTVNLGNTHALSGLNSSNSSISFKIPENIPPGRYDISVSNSKGRSETTVFFIVASPVSVLPVISQISPSTGFYGTEITIFGSNFTSTGNEIRSSYGVISNLSSLDGQTLKLKVEPFPETPVVRSPSDTSQGVEWDIDFYVVNDNGIGKESGVFTLKI